MPSWTPFNKLGVLDDGGKIVNGNERINQGIYDEKFQAFSIKGIGRNDFLILVFWSLWL